MTMNKELMNDKDYRVLCDNQNYMQNVTADNLQVNPYVIIASDFSPKGTIDSFVMYVKAERVEANGLYVLEIRDEMYYVEDMEPYKCKFNSIFFYTPYTMCNYIPEIVRERKIVCYNRSDVVDPLRERIMSVSDNHTELPCEIVDVREKAKEIWPDLPDYEIETVVAQCGYDPNDFTDNALGEMNMVRCIYEQILSTKKGGERFKVC